MFVATFVLVAKGNARSFRAPLFRWIRSFSMSQDIANTDSSATESEDYSEEEMNDYLGGMSEEQKVCHYSTIYSVLSLVEMKSPLF